MHVGRVQNPSNLTNVHLKQNGNKEKVNYCLIFKKLKTQFDNAASKCVI